MTRLAGSFTTPPRAVSSPLRTSRLTRRFPFTISSPTALPLSTPHRFPHSRSPSSRPPPPSGSYSLRCVSGGAASGGSAYRGAEPTRVEPGGAEPEGGGSGVAEFGGVGSGGAEPEGAEPWGAESEGAESGGSEPECTKPAGNFVYWRSSWCLVTAGASLSTTAGESTAGGTGARAAGGTGAAGPGGARTGAAGTGGAAGVGARDPGAGDTGAGGAGPGGASAVGAGSGETGRPRLYFVPLLKKVPLSSPPASSLAGSPNPESDLVCAASLTVLRLLATSVTDHSFESAAPSALVAELLDFAATCPLDYAASLIAESDSDCLPSVGGECALGTDVLEDRQEDIECFAAAVPHLVSMLIAPEGDPDAPDIPTPRSYAEAIMGPYSS
ncbi:unnamed protein product [Closterium sp. NIES-54]